MTARLCFGYGSLVNRDTHNFSNLKPAKIVGWQRSWTHHVHSTSRRASSLSIVRAENVTINGLISRVEPHQFAALDEREAGYDLHSLPDVSLDRDMTDETVHTYISANHRSGDEDHPILQSYLDTVLSGFLNEFGEVGVHHFLETTVGWETPIRADRGDPIYPRATPLSASTATYFDQCLKEFGINRFV